MICGGGACHQALESDDDLVEAQTVRAAEAPVIHAFTPSIGGPITQEDAKSWIDAFDRERRKDTRSVFFGNEVLRTVLDTPGASGVSFFFARKIDEDRKERDTLVLIPTSQDGLLLWSSSAQTPS